MSHDFNRRIDRLEVIWPKPACPVCLGRPSRLLVVDAVTDEQLSESMPATGCPECGTPIYREYLIVDDESQGA